jgi:hypothetical protein
VQLFVTSRVDSGPEIHSGSIFIEEVTMRIISVAIAGAFLLAGMAQLSAAPMYSGPAVSAPNITLIQEKKKDETITQKVKRTWKRWTTPNQTFCARCLIPPQAVTCTVQAKDRAAGRSACQQRHPLCAITDDMRGCR